MTTSPSLRYKLFILLVLGYFSTQAQPDTSGYPTIRNNPKSRYIESAPDRYRDSVLAELERQRTENLKQRPPGQRRSFFTNLIVEGLILLVGLALWWGYRWLKRRHR